MPGMLDGVRVVEFAGIGPGPFCGMMLADHGAEVIRIDRPGARHDPADPLLRSRRTIAIDLKDAGGVALARAICGKADAVIEGFRPGVMERLGLGPDVLLGDNPALVYGRMTGWGQQGPLAQAAGHDINYIAVSGVLHTIGRAGEAPVPPANYVGDFGGGAMMLAFGIVSALLHVGMGGAGQVIDAAMTDGSALLSAMQHGFIARGMWRDARGSNLLDGAAHFYDCYETADGKHVAIGAIEPAFYTALLKVTGLADDPAFAQQMNPAAWPALKARLAEVFRTRTRDEWCAAMEGHDACFAPVLSMAEAPAHPQNAARGTFGEVGGVRQPMPAPRAMGTPAPPPRAPAAPDADRQAILEDLGLSHSYS